MIIFFTGRPHFPPPLGSWLTADHKTFSGHFTCSQETQQEKTPSIFGSHIQSGQHSFPFPPTPPKESTPDSVQNGTNDYQVRFYLYLIKIFNKNIINFFYFYL